MSFSSHFFLMSFGVYCVKLNKLPIDNAFTLLYFNIGYVCSKFPTPPPKISEILFYSLSLKVVRGQNQS